MRSELAYLLRLSSARVALGLSLLASLGMSTVSLLGVHGAESALLLSVLLPPMASLVSARFASRMRVLDPPRRLSAVVTPALLFGLLLVLVPLLVLGANALRVRNCTPGKGLSFMLLGPTFGVLLGSVVGVASGLWCKRMRRASTLALALPLGSLVLGLARFYTTPAIFAYGHFFGYFPGTLYDEGVTITTPLLSLRVVTSLWIAGLLLWLASTVRPTTLQPSLRPSAGRGALCSLALLLLGLALVAELYAPELGHASSTQRIRSELGGELESARCHIVFPRELPKRERERLASDCDFRVDQAERWLGLSHPEPVRVFLFRSAEEKQRAMGALYTHIAKPWRSEVYVHDTSWPHPVLGHEIVHVVARATGPGPFRVAARALGFWPDPALIEGVAVAAAFQPQGGLTPDEWSHALLELEMLPRLHELFGAGFLGQQKRLAYTVSGSVLAFVRTEWGAAALNRAYAGGDLAEAVGEPLDAIERKWHAHLRSRPLSDEALTLARARFEGPSIFSAVCPHALAELRGRLRGSLAAGDDPRAQDECEAILAIDPKDLRTRATWVGILSRLGQEERAVQEIVQLDAAGARALRNLAKHALADEHYRRGRHELAAELYRELLAEPSEPDEKRPLQVKLLAVDDGDDPGLRGPEHRARQAQLIFELLVGEPGERVDGAIAVHLSRELREVRSDGVPHYLEARQLHGQRRYARAAELFAQSRELGLPSSELALEALRLEGLALFAAGQLEASAEAARRYAQGESASRKAEAEDLLQRIAFTKGVRGGP